MPPLPAGSTAPLRGFLNIDKPPDVSSFDVVREVRRASGVRRVGHAGILDRPASGVLPVAIAEATRLIEVLMDAPKRYLATVTLGVETDTYDATGAVQAEADRAAVASVTRTDVEHALRPFTGRVMQRPPAFSAIKRDGEPLHRAARRGEAVEIDPRPVMIYGLTVLDYDPPHVRIDLRCGRGFYVRSLAHDLGRALGVGGHVSMLRRTAVGPFTIEDAVPLDQAVALLAAGDWEDLVHAPDAVLVRWPALLLGREGVAAVRQGRDIVPLPVHRQRAGQPGERARGYGPDGRLVALLEAAPTLGGWHPYRVFSG